MESRSYFKNQKSTPRKFREVVHEIKGMNPVQATVKLSTVNKKAAGMLNKLIKSAITNAKHTLKVTEDMLEFKLLTVEEGQKLKRFRAGSRGMAKAFLRRFSHVKIVLAPRKGEETLPEKKKTEKKETAKKPVEKETKKPEKKSEVTSVETKTEEK